MVSIFNKISISQTAGWPSNRKVKKWTNTILIKACSAATAEAEAKVYEREGSETKNKRNYILDELLKDRGQRVADYGESVSRVQETNVRKHVNSKIVQPVPSSYSFDVP